MLKAAAKGRLANRACCPSWRPYLLTEVAASKGLLPQNLAGILAIVTISRRVSAHGDTL